MSLKVLKAVFYDGEEHVMHLAACDLLAFLQTDCVAFKGDEALGAGTPKSPFGGMRTRNGWQSVINSLDGAKDEQFIRMADAMVIKAAKSYYMTAGKIDTAGVKDRGGPSYNEFRDLVKGTGLSDAEVAQGVRRLLLAETASLAENMVALAALAAALFLAEPKRNTRSFPINLMLLDLIENNIGYGRHDHKFTWNKVLWRDSFGDSRAREKTYRFDKDATTDLEAHQRGGKLPMSHTGASEQSQAAVPAHPPANTDFYFPNSEMEKEGSIVVRWLQHYLNFRAKDFRQRMIQVPVKGATSWAARAVSKEEPLTYMVTFEGIKSGGGANFGSYVNLASPSAVFPYEKLFVDDVKKALRLRNANLPALKLR